jgi:hypothetical protein
MNYGAMKTKVRMLLGETDSTNSYYTDAEIDTQINDSCLQVAIDIPILLTFGDLETIADQERYGLPTDFLQVKDVQQWTTGDTRRVAMFKKSYDEYEAIVGGNVDMTGEPYYYRIEFGATSTTAGSPPGDIWVYPVPVDTSYTLRLVYYQKPTAMSSSNEVTELPEFLHLMVCYHAGWHLAMKDDSSTKINILSALYAAEMDKAKRVVNKRDRTGAWQIRSGYGRSSLWNNQGNKVRRGPLR